MRKVDIEIGKTYSGRGGKRRVVSIQHQTDDEFPVVYYEPDKHCQGMISGDQYQCCNLSTFAMWAKEEVPA